MKDIKAIIESFFNLDKVPAKLVLLLALTGLIYFHAPKEYGIIKFTHDKETTAWLYLLFMLSCVMSVLNLVFWVKKVAYRQYRIWLLKKEYRRVLVNLDPYEIAFIQKFFTEKRNTLDLPYDDPVIQGLVAKEVLITSSSLGPKAFIISGNMVSYSLNKYMRSEIAKSKVFD